MQARQQRWLAATLAALCVFFVAADKPDGISGRYEVQDVARWGGAGLSLVHLSDYALRNGIGRLRLETGIYQPEAIRLYEGLGFQRIPPFGDYEEEPYSRFYEKPIR